MAGLSDDELARRYREGRDSLTELARAAAMSVSGLQRRLRRLGVAPQRRSPRPSLSAEALASALASYGSARAAAAALGIGRAALVAEAQRHGLAHALEVPDDLVAAYQSGSSLDELARRYKVSKATVSHWLRASGATLRPPGRPPRP